MTIPCSGCNSELTLYDETLTDSAIADMMCWKKLEGKWWCVICSDSVFESVPPTVVGAEPEEKEGSDDR